MFIIRNCSKQELPIDVVKNGVTYRVFLKPKSSIESEEKTIPVKRLEKKGFLKVKESVISREVE